MIMQLFKKYQQPILYLFFGVCTTAVNIITYYLCAHPLHFICCSEYLYRMGHIGIICVYYE